MGVMKRQSVAKQLGTTARGVRIAFTLTPEGLLTRHRKRKKTILFKEGAYVKTSIQRSQRYSKKTSKPGSPPSAHKDNPRGPLLRKLTAFAVDLEADSVIAGPMLSGPTSPTTPEVLDQGGYVPVERLLHDRDFNVLDFGPIRYLGGGKFLNIRLQTPDQCERAKRLRDEENAIRAGKGSIKIAARPFTKPALTDGGKNLAKLTKSIPL